MNMNEQNRRGEDRIKTSLPITLVCDALSQEIQSTVTDISLGGHSCVLEKELPLNIDFVQANFSNFKADCQVVWRDDSAKKYGLKFKESYPQTATLIEEILSKKNKFYEKIVRVPHNEHLNYQEEFIAHRRAWVEKTMGNKFSHVAHYSIDPENVRGNIENFIGVAQVPVGLVGPIKINGEYAQGTYYVPFATTEGALVSTYQRGAISITKSGGTHVRVVKDSNYLDPVFILKNGAAAQDLADWVEKNSNTFNTIIKDITRHGKLIKIIPIVIGRRLVLKVSYFTEDAMGANMINLATQAICRFIQNKFNVERYILRSNYSSEKKGGAVNLITNYGKEVHVEVTIPKRIVRLCLNTTAEEIAKAWTSWTLGSISAGVLGMSAQIGNGVSAMYIALGQDVAHVSNASVGVIMFEENYNGDLYAALKLPNIIVGSLGGGTALGTQREFLQMLGCYGEGKSKKLAEIIASTILAGEIGICAGLISDQFLDPHIKASFYTKKKAYEDSEK